MNGIWSCVFKLLFEMSKFETRLKNNTYTSACIYRCVSQLTVGKFAFLAKGQHGETLLSPSSNAKMST